MKKYKWHIIISVIFFLAATAAQAHMFWLTPDNRVPKAGETVNLTIGFGHHFAPDAVMEKADRLERVYAVTPDGLEIDARAISPSTYTFIPEIEGDYSIYAAMKSGCMSTTTEGRKMGNRKTLSNVVSCFGFKMSAMTSLTCGNGSGGDFEKDVLTVEIIPQKDPATVKVGDILPLLVLYQGKPLAGAELAASGVNSEKEKDQSWDQETETGADGIAHIKISAAGPWLFSARNKIPYSDPEACDEMIYSTTLTLDF